MAHSDAEALEVSRLVLEEITTKWSLPVLACLCAGPMRFNALRRAIPKATQKALTQCLRRLEGSGFITRTIISTAPVAVVYDISSMGRSIEPHLLALLSWANENREAVLAAKRLSQQEAAA